jgi:SPP1 gp7 family putative phage head morphogenesis protein
VCERCDVLQAGAAAADALLRDVYRLEVAKASDPLDPDDFIKITGRLSRRLRKVAHPIEQRARDRAKSALDVDWRGIPPDIRAGAIADGAGAIADGNEKLLPQLDAVLKVTAPEIVGDTRKNVVRRYDLSIAADTNERDDRTANYVRTSETMFVRDASGRLVDIFSERARQIVADGLDRGAGRDEISADLAVALDHAGRPDAYWDLIATSFSNRARNYTQVHAFDEAAIAAYRWDSVMDQVTSAICRFMNGREFRVDRAVKRIADVMALEDPEAIKDTVPWLQQGKQDGRDIIYFERGGDRHVVAHVERSDVGVLDGPGKFDEKMTTAELEKAGIQFPPAHARCRATVNPVV